MKMEGTMTKPARDHDTSKGGLDHDLTYFYLDPQPKLVEEGIRRDSEEGWIDNPSTAFLFVYWGTVFGQFPERLSEWLQSLADLPTTHRQFIYRAIWFSDCPEGRALLESLQKGSGPDVDFLKEITQEEPLNLLTMEISDPSHLDMLWDGFMASGERRFVERIIGALLWFQDGSNLGELMIGKAAAWSLASNAMQHGKVLDICREVVDSCPAGVEKKLSMVIEEAEKRIGEMEEKS